jgi:hypothetical protein
VLGLEPDLVAHQADRVPPERIHEGAVDAGKRLAHDVQRLRRRHAPASDELDAQATPRHLVADLRPGAVHDADLVAAVREREYLVDDVAEDGAAALDDDAAHVR